MKEPYSKHIKTFLAGLVPCIIVFSALLCLAILPNNNQEHSVAKQNLPDIPYNAKQTVIVIKTPELPTCFLLKLLPKRKSFFIWAIPFNSVKNSSANFSKCQNIDEFSDFLEIKINYIIELSNDNLSKLINYLNGIVAETPYGVPSPVGTQLINDDNEKTRLFSGSIINLLSIKKQPDQDMLEYQAYLMGLVVEGFLKNLDDEEYFLLKESSNICLSYASYFNNKDIIKECANSNQTSFYEGVWIEDLYYLV